MRASLEQIKNDISRLPPVERYRLWRELEAEFNPSPVDDEDGGAGVENAWDEEIAARCREIEEGTVELLSVEEAKRRMAAFMAKLRAARQSHPA